MADQPVVFDAQMLRALAATVAGHPLTGPYFLVAVNRHGRWDIHQDDETRQPLRFQGSDRELALRDPANTRANAAKPADGVLIGPFSSPGTARDYHVRIRSVDAVKTGTNGYGLCWAVDDTADLLCWTPSAFRKFIAPYYYQLAGSTRQAADLVEERVQKMLDSESGILMHRWPSSTDTLGTDFTPVIGPPVASPNT